jgi:hypothetical protein
MTVAGAGFKLHTGWAALVVAAGGSNHVSVLLRRRIELLPDDGSVPRFVYHAAAELALPQASQLVKRAASAAQAAAGVAVQQVLDELRSTNVIVGAAGILTSSATLPTGITDILRSHTLIHTAEGALFQQAVAAACEGCGLRVIRIRERELWGKPGDNMREQLDGLKKSVGPPWGADQKSAAAAALAALRASR